MFFILDVLGLSEKVLYPIKASNVAVSLSRFPTAIQSDDDNGINNEGIEGRAFIETEEKEESETHRIPNDNPAKEDEATILLELGHEIKEDSGEMFVELEDKESHTESDARFLKTNKVQSKGDKMIGSADASRNVPGETSLSEIVAHPHLPINSKHKPSLLELKGAAAGLLSAGLMTAAMMGKEYNPFI